MSKIIKTKQEARDSLIKGVDMVADIVRETIGPKGSNVVFTDRYGMPTVTNDGVSIAKEVHSDDEIEQLGIDIIKQSSLRTNFLAGDGTTTSIVLAQAIVHEGMKSSENPIELRNKINGDSLRIIEELKKSAKPISSFEEIKRIATLSAENEEIGFLIATAANTVGKDGRINVQESEISGVSVEYVNGLEIDEGYIIPAMMNQENGTAIVQNPYILIVDAKLSNIKDIAPVVELVAAEGVRQLIVVCDGMDGNVLPTVVANKYRQDGKPGFEIIGVRLPAIRKQEIMADIALVTQGKVFGMSTGVFPKDAKITDLGRCDKIVVEEKNTAFIGGKGNVDTQVELLRNQRDASEINKDRYDERIAWLLGKIAVIKVGAPTDSELRYMKLKIDDAVCATKAAIEEGVVRGGGMALKVIANMLDLSDVMKNALQAPYNQIQTNAGGVLRIEDDVYDPVKVTRLALENAVSCAGILLTTHAAIAERKIVPKAAYDYAH